MKVLAVIAILLFAASADFADTGTQDNLTLTYGYACDTADACSFQYGWAINDGIDGLSGGATDESLGLFGTGVSIGPVAPPVPGLGFTSTATIVEWFNVDPTCDAGASIFVCDEMILGLFTNGVALTEQQLPWDGIVQTDLAELGGPVNTTQFASLTTVPATVAEPSALWLLLAGAMALALCGAWMGRGK